MNEQTISSPSLSTEKVGLEYVPFDSQIIDDDNIVDTKRLIKIKEKVEEAAEAADKASLGFEKLFSTLRDLATVSHGTSETWDDAVRQYMSTERKTSNLQISTSPANSSSSKAFVQFADTTADIVSTKKVTRRRRQKKLKDPNRPKKPPNAFMMFLVEQCDAMKANLPPGALHAPQVGKIVGEKWKGLAHEQKKVYEDRYELSKKKYEEDLKHYYSNREDNSGGSPTLISFRTNSVIKNNKITVVSSPSNPPEPIKTRRYSGMPNFEPLTPDSNNHLAIVSQPMKKRKYKKRVDKPKDENRPKKPANPYAMYLAEQCHLMKTKPDPSNALNAPHIGRVISERWRKLSVEGKKIYQDRYHIEKKRYDQEMKIYNQSLRNLTPISKNLVVPIEDHDSEGLESEKEDHKEKLAAIPFKSTSGTEGVPILNDDDDDDDDDEDGIPLPNGDDDDYDIELTEKDTVMLKKGMIQGKIRVEPSDTSDMQDIVRTSGILKSSIKKETLDITIPRERKRARDIEESEDTSDIDSQDEAAVGSDSTGLGTLTENGEISPSKWSLKGLFSNFKRPKFF